jgi:DNA mismatch repair protein MutS
VTRLPGWNFEVEPGARLATQTLSVHSLAGFGLTDSHPALGAAGAVLTYVTNSLCAQPKNLFRLMEAKLGAAVLLDAASARNLELFAASNGGREGSLLDTIDRTATPPESFKKPA